MTNTIASIISLITLCVTAFGAYETKPETVSPGSNAHWNALGLVSKHVKPSADRIPSGAETPEAAAEIFFKAFKANDRKAAAEVAADGPVEDLFEMRGVDKISPFKLVSETVIYFDGGSLELKIVKNYSGRFYVNRVIGSAD